MQYITAPANAWNAESGPEMLFFDAKDNADLDSPNTDLLLNKELRKARTTLAQNKRTMMIGGQGAGVFYLTELSRCRPSNPAPSLSDLCRPSVNARWGAHSVPNTVGIYINTNMPTLTLIPPTFNGTRSVYLPQLGVRSAISASRSYTVFVGMTFRNANEGTGLLNANGNYQPPASPSGGTFAYGENNSFLATSDYSHFAWPISISVSDTGYGPAVAYPDALSIKDRGLRVKQQIQDTETVDLSKACLNYSGLMIKLRKGVDYSVQNECVPGETYPVDFTNTQKTYLM